MLSPKLVGPRLERLPIFRVAGLNDNESSDPEDRQSSKAWSNQLRTQHGMSPSFSAITVIRASLETAQEACSSRTS